MFVTIRNFRGRGYGAGDKTVRVWLSMSTPVLEWMTSHHLAMTSHTSVNIHAEEASRGTGSHAFFNRVGHAQTDDHMTQLLGYQERGKEMQCELCTLGNILTRLYRDQQNTAIFSFHP